MKSVIRSIKNEINNYDEGERLVRELTSNERTPPSTQMLIKLKIMLSDSYQFPTVVRMLFKRLKDYNNIRHVEKSLICIEYLIKNSDRKFVRFCQVEKKQVSKLSRYRYILGDDTGAPVDYGGNIRKRAKRICDLLGNENKLRDSRAKAQGYAMQFKNKSKPKSKRTQQRSQNTAKVHRSHPKPQQKTIQQPPQQKKDKKKKKKVKKKEEPKEPEEPQYESFIDVPPDDKNGAQPQEVPDDLLSGDWWNQEEAAAAKDDEDEFGWFQGGDVAQETGVGDDGGAFGFGDDDDFNDEEKEEDLDADSWMTTLTTTSNVLTASVQKKDGIKRNKKGTSMAQMAKKQPVSQAIPNSFGTDAFFNENSGDTAVKTQNDDGFDPFGLGSNSGNNSGASSITSLYNKSNQNNQNNQNKSGFGYQSKASSNPYNADPFAGIGSSGAGPTPAKYVHRKKQSDPFAQFGMQ